MTTIELREYEAWIGRLASDDLDELVSLAGDRLVVGHRPHRQVEVKATAHVGVLVTQNVTVRVRPKVPLDNLFFMLDARPDRLAIDWRAAPYAEVEDDLVTAVVQLFAAEVERLTGRGLLHGYVEHHDRLVGVRGRIDLAEMAHRPWQITPLACRFDEFVPDIAVNRILLTALTAARAAPGIPASLRGELHLLRQRLEGVSAAPVTVRDVDRWQPTRIDRHYGTAIGLARIILRHLTLADRHGQAAAASFTIDMNKLFEDFLGRELAARLPADLEITEQYATHLARAGRFSRLPMQPDYLIHDLGRPDRAVYVADAKYKLTEALGSNADHYQLLAYLTRLGLREGVLVYCQRPDHEPGDAATGDRHATVSITGTDIDHHVYRLDLSGHRRDIATRLDSLAAWLLGRIGDATSSPAEGRAS